MKLIGITISESNPERLVETLTAYCLPPESDTSKQAIPDTVRPSECPRTIGYINAHVFNTCWTEPEVWKLLQVADYVYADGASMSWASRITRQERIRRTTAADWFADVLERLAGNGIRMYFVGGEPGVSESFVDMMRKNSQRSDCYVGASAGYFEDRSEADVVRMINALDIDLLIVGMGTPHQESFVFRHKERLRVRAIWWVGAAMDYYVGVQARGPEWTRNIGHEWLGRLIENPSRLGKRYLLGNPQFLWRVVRGKEPQREQDEES